jgi:protein ImuA
VRDRAPPRPAPASPGQIAAGGARAAAPITPLIELADRIRTLERGTPGQPPAAPLTFPDCDPLLEAGAVHEWITDDAAPGLRAPPLSIFMALAARALAARAGIVVWLSPRLWPYPPAFSRSAGALLLARSLFINPPDASSALWAIDLALRSRAVAAVFADGLGFDMAASRRLQLAAYAGGAWGFLARPAREAGALSAAATRWRVSPAPSTTDNPRWTVHLMRCKGLHAHPPSRIWTVELTDAQSLIVVPPHLADGSGAKKTPAAIQRSA